MLDVLDRNQATGAASAVLAAEDQTESCAGCHFWHFGHCVHVTRYGHVGDGLCSHHKDAHAILEAVGGG
jgi:hypothetical protein